MTDNLSSQKVALPPVLSASEEAQLRGYIDHASHIVITCHVSPDGDAMGSTTGLANYLQRKGKEVQIITPNAFPDFLDWLPGAHAVLPYDKNVERCLPIVKACDLFLCLDFNAPGRMESLADAVIANPAPKVMIDHHPNPDTFWNLAISHPEMSSTCELLFNVLTQIDDFADMTHDEATCIYTGMMTDTGNFSYNSNRSDIYYIISLLLTKNIDKDGIYRNVFNNYGVNRFRLLGYMLNDKLVVYPPLHAAIMTMTRPEQRRYNHKKGDTEGFVNIPLQIKGVRLSIFMRENTDKDTIRISLRSIGSFPCNKMAAEFFNGGGHPNASGGELVCSMAEAIDVAKRALVHFESLLVKED